MDPFLKISVLQANFCWLGDLERVICPGKESVAGRRLQLKELKEGRVHALVCLVLHVLRRQII